MCIIAYKPAGINLPDVDKLTQMFNNNPDGAGIAYTWEGQIKVIKGLMTLDSFLDIIQNIPDAQARDIVIHCRIATHGGVSAGLTHPFPVSNNKKNMHVLEYTHDVAMFHNGMLNIMERNGLSDSAIFAMRVLYPVKHQIFEDKKLQKKASKEIGYNKILIMRAEKIIMLGNWPNEIEDGVIYSNRSYIERAVYKYTSSYDWNSYITKRKPERAHKSVNNGTCYGCQLIHQCEVQDYDSLGYLVPSAECLLLEPANCKTCEKFRTCSDCIYSTKYRCYQPSPSCPLGDFVDTQTVEMKFD
jgi:predicted glutamine amidotransferase